MKETFAGELIGKTLVIEYVPTTTGVGYKPFPAGWQVAIRVRETGERVENVSEVVVTCKAGDIVTAEVTLVHIEPWKNSATPWEEPVDEKVIIKNPEIHLEALVMEEMHLMERQIAAIKREVEK